MLHAFSAETGEELFAYVPNLIFENLKMLPKPNYSHMYFVDLTPVKMAVDMDDGQGGTEWKTILIGGLAKGGKGYYALDITGITDVYEEAESALANRVMWEYPRSGVPDVDIDDLGFSYSRPSIVRTNDDSHPWVVIFGNGYNSMNSHAVLFIMDPFDGTLIAKIDTGAPLP